MDYKRIKRFITGAELVLFVPLIGMMISNTIDWGLLDFIMAAVSLAVLGFAVSLIANRNGTLKQIVFGIIITGLTVITWAELAVGIFSSPIAGS